MSFMHPNLQDTEEKEVKVNHLTVDLDKNKGDYTDYSA